METAACAADQGREEAEQEAEHKCDAVGKSFFACDHGEREQRREYGKCLQNVQGDKRGYNCIEGKVKIKNRGKVDGKMRDTFPKFQSCYRSKALRHMPQHLMIQPCAVTGLSSIRKGSDQGKR